MVTPKKGAGSTHHPLSQRQVMRIACVSTRQLWDVSLTLQTLDEECECVMGKIQLLRGSVALTLLYNFSQYFCGFPLLLGRGFLLETHCVPSIGMVKAYLMLPFLKTTSPFCLLWVEAVTFRCLYMSMPC